METETETTPFLPLPGSLLQDSEGQIWEVKSSFSRQLFLRAYSPVAKLVHLSQLHLFTPVEARHLAWKEAHPCPTSK